MKKRGGYPADPGTRHIPLSEDEVEALIVNQGKALTRSEESLVHFLHRVAATLRHHRVRMSGLASDVSKMTADRELRSQPIARALEALALLSDDERNQVLDAGYITEVRKVQKATEELELSRLALMNESNRLRFTFAGVLADESIPVEARQKIADALARAQSFQPPSA